jgi:hypothetical protein
MMKRRRFLLASGVGALLPILSQGQATPDRRKRTLVFKLAAPVMSGCFMVRTKEPATLIHEDAPLPLTPELIMWAREVQVGRTALEMSEVRIVRLPDNGNWLKETGFVSQPAMSLQSADAQARVFNRHGARYQRWLFPWKQPEGPCGLLRCPLPVTWTWALITCEAEEVRVYFARELRVTDLETGEVHLADEVVTFNNDGFSIVESAKIIVLPETVLATFGKTGGIIAVRHLTREQMLAEMARPAAQ